MKTAAAILLTLALSAAALSAAEDYVIRLDRPSKIGERYRVDATGSTREHNRITMGGQVQEQDKDLSVHLVAVVTVLAVDASLEPIRMEYLVESCKKVSEGRTTDVLTAGRKVVAESDKEGNTVFAVDGDPALQDIATALHVVITAHVPGTPSDDLVFGTTGRKRVGETWSIDSKVAAESFSRGGLNIQDLEGTVTLQGVRKVGLVEALEITARIRAHRMTMADLPEWLRVEKSSMTGEITGMVPADPEAPSLLPDKMTMRISLTMRGKNPESGSTVTMDVSMETSLEHTYAPFVLTESASLDSRQNFSSGFFAIATE